MIETGNFEARLDIVHAKTSENSLSCSWQESAILLDLNQRTAAEIAFSVELLKVINDEVNLRVPLPGNKFLSDSAVNEQKEKRLRYVAGMLDLYHAKTQGFDAEQKLKAQWGEEADVIDSRLSSRIKEIEDRRDTIFSEATTWGPQDGKRVSREASEYVYTLPKEQRIHLHEKAGFTPEDIKVVLPRILVKRYGVETSKHIISATLNLVSSHALEAVAFAAGATAAAANPLSEADKVIVVATVTASYIAWLKELTENTKENWNLLEAGGVSSSFTSKLLYDTSKKLSANRAVHKIAAHTGFIFWQTALEVPWYISAFWSGIEIPNKISNLTGVDPKNSEWAYIAGANFAAAAYNWAQAKGTQIFLEHKDQIKHIGAKVKYFSKK